MTPPPGYTLVDSKSFAEIMRLMTREQMQQLTLWEAERFQDHVTDRETTK